MSWGFEFSGTKESVKQKVTEYCDQAASNYVGKPEADDVISVKSRVLTLIDAVELNEQNEDVLAKGNGSHSTENGLVTHAQAAFTVNRCVRKAP